MTGWTGDADPVDRRRGRRGAHGPGGRAGARLRRSRRISLREPEKRDGPAPPRGAPTRRGRLQLLRGGRHRAPARGAGRDHAAEAPVADGRRHRGRRAGRLPRPGCARPPSARDRAPAEPRPRRRRPRAAGPAAPRPGRRRSTASAPGSHRAGHGASRRGSAPRPPAAPGRPTTAPPSTGRQRHRDGSAATRPRAGRRHRSRRGPAGTAARAARPLPLRLRPGPARPARRGRAGRGVVGGRRDHAPAGRPRSGDDRRARRDAPHRAGPPRRPHAPTQARALLRDVLTDALRTDLDRSVRALPHDGRPGRAARRRRERHRQDHHHRQARAGAGGERAARRAGRRRHVPRRGRRAARHLG